QAGNYLLNSDALEQWTPFRGVQVVANAGPAPDGSASAEQIHDSATENGARLYSNTIVAEGGPYVFSCYLKAGTLSQAKLTIADGNGSSVRAYIQPSLGSGWQRYVVSLGSTTASSTLRVELYPGKFDKENGYVWAWGAQLEKGSSPSPYTRPADEASTLDATPPATPSGLVAEPSPDSVQVRWTPNTEADLAGYRVQRAMEGAGYATISEPPAAELVDSAVAAGDACYYRVAAVDAAGNTSAYSQPVAVTVPSSDPVQSPVSGKNLIEFPEEFEKWGSFREASAVANAGVAPTGPATADHVVDSLTQNGGYLFSNSVAADGGPYTLSCYLKAGSLAKAKLAIFDSSGSVRGFAEPNLTTGWQRYSVTLATTPKGTMLRAGLYAGKFDKESGYIWAWGAQLESGSAATSYPAGDGSTPADTTPPATPAGLSATVDAGAIQLRWTANGESDLAKYRLQRGPNSTSFTTLVEPLTAEHRDSAVSAGLTYYYRVAAVDGSGNASAYSNPVSVSIPVPPDTTPPAAPAGLTGALTSDAIQLRWNPNTDPDVAEYRVERGTNSTSSFSALSSPTSAGYADAAVTAGNSYSYRVRAVDVAGNVSAASTTVTVAVPLAPPAPTGALNVLDFGANPAAGGDDAGAIQAAFNAAATQDKDVYLPAGHYWISRTVSFRAAGRTVYGAGMTLTIVAGNTNSYNLLQFDRIRDCTVRDLRFEGSHLNDDKVNINRAVDCYATVNTLIQRVYCYGAGYIAFDNGGSRTTIEDCVIEDYGRIGYLANDGATVRRCRFFCRDSWNFTGEQHGIYASAGRTNILIEDNEFINCGAYAIQLWGSQSGVWTENVLIQRNTFTRCKNVLVVGAGSSGPSYRSVRFLANTIRQSQEKDIRIMKFNGSTANGTELLIEGNIFEDTASSYGFMIINYGGAPITGVRIRNNQFLGPNRSSYQGILHLQASGAALSDIVVEGNLFQDFGHSGASERAFPAIWLRSGSGITIQDNTFVHWSKAGYGYDVDGVRFDSGATNVSITRNVFTGTGLARCYGVRVTSSGSATNGSITGNQFNRAKLQANGAPASGNTFQ
ncbi:MAG: phage head spike fiber domain-containing protein, partial [Actinomycetota bacterium]